MGFKNLVARLDDVLRELDKGKSLKRNELERLQRELEKKQAKYRDQIESGSGSSRETPAQTEVRLRVVEAQLAKLRELMEDESL
jgi:Skp family chaperone for outer membrane proteins